MAVLRTSNFACSLLIPAAGHRLPKPAPKPARQMRILGSHSGGASRVHQTGLPKRHANYRVLRTRPDAHTGQTLYRKVSLSAYEKNASFAQINTLHEEAHPQSIAVGKKTLPAKMVFSENWFSCTIALDYACLALRRRSGKSKRSILKQVRGSTAK